MGGFSRADTLAALRRYTQLGGVLVGTGDSTQASQLAPGANGTFLVVNSAATLGLNWRALLAADLPLFVASGGSHAPGAVPDPGSSSGTTKFLREDASFAVPPGTGLTQAYVTVQDEGSALTQRSTLNVVGRGIVADDSGGVTRLRSFDPATMTYMCDDFLAGTITTLSVGALNWTFGGGAGSTPTAVAGHPGLFHRAGNAANGSIVTSIVPTFLPAEFFDLTWIFRPTDLDGNQSYRLGLCTAPTSTQPASDGIYLEGLSTDFAASNMTWFGVTRASSSQNRITTAVATANNAWVNVRIRRIDASTIGFTVNGATEVTLASTVPTAALSPFITYNATNSVAHNYDIDFFDLLITSLAR